MKKSVRRTVVSISVPLLRLREGEVLGVAGSCPELGEWGNAMPMSSGLGPFSVLSLEVSAPFEYKFVVLDSANGSILYWEEGANRYTGELPLSVEGESVLRIRADRPRIHARAWKGAGTAIPVFSLRSENSFGVGDFMDLKRFVDWADATGQSVIQLLPINDTTMSGTWEDSYPYNANSTFALHPQFINLQAAGVPCRNKAYVELQRELNSLDELDYERVNAEKTRLLKAHFAKNAAKIKSGRAYRKFYEENSDWLLPYALFRVLTAETGTADFSQWGVFSKFGIEKIELLSDAQKAEMDFHVYEQMLLFSQLDEAIQYAHSKGIMLKGDLPIGISRTSADAWQHPELFHMDSQAGAPPDAFSAFGQNWGFPTYNWEKMSEDGYAWWKSRLATMGKCFDAFRIDHILGFFRIWEIPLDAVHGLLGYFNPALPYTAAELRDMGFDMSGGRYVSPLTDDWALDEAFGEDKDMILKKCFKDGKLKPTYSTQRKAAEKLDSAPELRDKLLNFMDDVLFIEDPRKKGCYHPRIAAHSTRNYRSLDLWHKEAFNRLYDDFFYRRHNGFWKESAYRKLPALLGSTSMLACGEDLGMIPACVPDTMKELKILSLEIQRMPKSLDETFAKPQFYPYMSVCATSTHDMNPLRAWWEEDREVSARFYHEALGCGGEPPYFCEPWVCRRIVEQHLYSPSMFAILPLQDWLSMDADLRIGDPRKERINVPAIPRYYWRYRMHLTIEQLLDSVEFNSDLAHMVEMSGRGK